MAGKDYSIRLASKNETEAIVTLINEHYLPEETIFQNYISKNKKKISPEEEKVMTGCIKKILECLLTENSALVAVHQDSKKIIGAIMLLPHENPKNQKAKRFSGIEMEIMKSKLLPELFYYVEMMSGKIKVFQEFPQAEKALKLSFLAVDKSHRKKGLATDLLKESIKWAKSNGFNVAHGTFSSVHSKRAAEKEKLKSIENYDLQTFRDFGGSEIFTNASPNNIISVMALKLN